MTFMNIEIKARCFEPKKVRGVLEEHNAEFKGVDHQIDTYFQVASGRMKLREGKIENALIHYDRSNESGPKQSDVTLYRFPLNPALKEVLIRGLETLVVVDKVRGIYFIENVKFHVDDVKNLGSFLEIEAIDEEGNIGREKLMEQCQYYLNLLGVKDEDLIAESYKRSLKAPLITYNFYFFLTSLP